MKNKKLVKLLLSCVLLAGCAQETQKKPEQKLQAYSNISLNCGFNTFFSLKEYTSSKEIFDKNFKLSTDTFKHCNDLFDIYNTYDGINNIKTINDNAGKKEVKVDPLIIEMLDEAKYFYDLSDGEFDITMGNLLHVWHNYREEGLDLNEEGKLGNLPSQQELDEAFSHRGFDSIEINKEDNTVFIKDPNVSLDVGGIAKGFAAEYVAKVLEENGVEQACNVNAGGNNRTIGSKIDGSPWRIGIQNPKHEGSLLAVDMKGSISSVTSGDYERYYVASDHQRYHHIIDPKTKRPANFYHSVTIFTQNSGDADCLSTALFTMELEKGKDLLKKYNNDHPNTPAYAVWIMDDSEKAEQLKGKKVDEFYVCYSEELEDHLVWR